uniref:Uncharacterized mitochondrial protein AtMg00810-like n=1 Tax=Nicotiana tabacum TaxID=4097 RepID=A0A1S3YAM4_TOBAC|nr:PREDICTED: uncharacterized mitochondrial protein AtMg00810-like [Nicotiana tabacum]
MITVRTVMAIAALKHWPLFQMDSKHDYSLFTKTTNGAFVLIRVYVDDFLGTSNDLAEIQSAKEALHKNFKLKALGELRYFLGIEFARSSEGIIMSQRKYTLEMISEAGLSGSRPKESLMEQHLKLTSAEFDELIKTESSDECFSQFVHAPKMSHYEEALHVVRYVKNQPGLGLLMSRTGVEEIVAYCDSGWALCPTSRKLVTGFCIKLGASLISWKEKK